jgi:hypothetical protein
VSTPKWKSYINTSSGYSVTPTGTFTFLRKLKDYPVSGRAINASGYLNKNDITYGQNKQFKMTRTQAENALDKILNIDKTSPNYDLHSNNCVDNAIAVAKEGGTILKSNCKKEVKIRKGASSKSGTIALPSELENELK